MLKQQHYTLTNVKKVKSQSTTPLSCFTCDLFPVFQVCLYITTEGFCLLALNYILQCTLCLPFFFQGTVASYMVIVGYCLNFTVNSQL